jgi:branched-chain amino acid transport system substrate-binding protein
MPAEVTPVKVGVLYDYPLKDPNDLCRALQLALHEAVAAGVIDRPVEIVEKRTVGLPTGSYRVVQDGFDELVEKDCLVIFGQLASENAVPLTAHVEKVAEVPLIHMGGSENALGEWMFELNNGSMAEEPAIMAAVMRFDGHQRVAIAYERSLLGYEYLASARVAADRGGLDIVGEVAIPQVETEKLAAMRELQSCKPDAIMHVGFGHGLLGMNKGLTEIGWNPPRYTTTAFEFAHASADWMQQLAGWIGMDSYDERNVVGQAFLDRFAAHYDRPRRGYYLPCYGYDMGQVVALGIAGARPLTGAGVKAALEQVKMIPAASGAPGTMLRFGRYIRQGWLGSEYLVARRILPDGSDHVLHGTITGLVTPDA